MGGLLMWYSFVSFDNFSIWHDSVCTGLGIPHPCVNAATGEIDENSQWVEAYTNVIEISENDWRAFIENDIAVNYSDGIGAPCDAPPIPEEI